MVARRFPFRSPRAASSSLYFRCVVHHSHQFTWLTHCSPALLSRSVVRYRLERYLPAFASIKPRRARILCSTQALRVRIFRQEVYGEFYGEFWGVRLRQHIGGRGLLRGRFTPASRQCCGRSAGGSGHKPVRRPFFYILRCNITVGRRCPAS